MDVVEPVVNSDLLSIIYFVDFPHETLIILRRHSAGSKAIQGKNKRKEHSKHSCIIPVSTSPVVEVAS
jgi:hypothetical protein